MIWKLSGLLKTPDRNQNPVLVRYIKPSLADWHGGKYAEQSKIYGYRVWSIFATNHAMRQADFDAMTDYASDRAEKALAEYRAA
jgi:hypothetical protein